MSHKNVTFALSSFWPHFPSEDSFPGQYPNNCRTKLTLTDSLKYDDEYILRGENGEGGKGDTELATVCWPN